MMDRTSVQLHVTGLTGPDGFVVHYVSSTKQGAELCKLGKGVCSIIGIWSGRVKAVSGET